MKIEIRREQTASLQVFYWVYNDDISLRCFYAGEMPDSDILQKEGAALQLARNWKESFIANYSVQSTTIIESIEI